MAHAGGRPPKYKNVEEIEEKIEQYFAICEGEPLLDDEGNQVINKNHLILLSKNIITL